MSYPAFVRSITIAVALLCATVVLPQDDRIAPHESPNAATSETPHSDKPPAKATPQKRKLAIFLHGFDATSSSQYLAIQKVFESSEYDFKRVTWPATSWARAKPEEVTKKVLADIEKLLPLDDQNIDELVLLAHSMGCVALKSAIIEAHSNKKGSPLLNSWLTTRQKNMRLLMIANTNRGYRSQTLLVNFLLESVHRWFWLAWFVILFIFLVIPIWRPEFLVSFIAFVKTLPGQIMFVTCINVAVFFGCWRFNYAWGQIVYLEVITTLLCVWVISFAKPFWFIRRWLVPPLLLCALFAFVWPIQTGLLFEQGLLGSSWISRLRFDWMSKTKKGDFENLRVTHIFGTSDFLVDDDDFGEFDGDAYVLNGVDHQGWVDINLDDSIKNRLTAWISDKEITISTSDGERKIDNPMNHRPKEEKNQAKDQPDGEKKESLTKPVDDVVFLVHGIRDYGEWQESLADRIKAEAKGNVEVVLVRYGYFNSFQFLLWPERDRATRVFLDAYTQAKTRHTNAKFHIAAHSHGTFVVANSLDHDVGVKFENVYLAGSVLPQEFGENKIFEVEKVHSDCASFDWPVGVICWIVGLPRVLVGDDAYWIGDGGFAGFKSTTPWKNLTERKSIPGDHGTALRAKHHGDIAKFLLEGKEPAKSGNTVPFSGLQIHLARAGVVLGLVVLVLTIAYLFKKCPSDILWGIVVGAEAALFTVLVLMAI